MSLIDVRPQILDTAHAFSKNDLRLTAVVDPEIDFTAEDVRAEIWSAFKKLYEIENVVIDGQNIYIDLTQPQVEKLPTAGRCFVIFKGDYKWGYNISVDLGFGTPFNTSATLMLNLKGDKGDPGDLTAEAQELKALMVEDRQAVAEDKQSVITLAGEVSADAIATETARAQAAIKAGEAAADRIQTGLDRTTVGNLKTDVVQLKADTNQIKIDAAQIKADTLAIYNQTSDVTAKLMHNWQVATKAAADLFAPTLSYSSFIEVVADETQGNIPALYYWNRSTLQEPLLL